MTQIDLVLKQVLSSLDTLKHAIEKFEKHPAPSTHYTEQLYAAIQESTKVTAAYLVLKEQKDVSPDLDLHIKLMAVPSTTEKVLTELVAEPIVIEEPVVEPIQEYITPVEPIKETITISEPIEAPKVEPKKTYPALSININDKFRLINELFKTNAAEYNIAMEQINAIDTPEDANAYLKGLKGIYDWDENHEMVKRLSALTQKRFV